MFAVSSFTIVVGAEITVICAFRMNRRPATHTFYNWHELLPMLSVIREHYPNVSVYVMGAR